MKKINNLRVVLPMALVLASVAYLGLSVASLFLAPAHVGASVAPDGTFRRLAIGQGDYVWNWDFNDESEAFDGVDWGMRFIFYNNADVDEVKDRLDGKMVDPRITPFLSYQGWFQYAGMQDSYEDEANQWDQDRGIKDDPGCSWNYGHMRVYATSGDYNYNLDYGYYVVASTHRDHESHFLCDDQYFSTESNEDWWVARIRDNLGSNTDYNWTVYDEAFNWKNSVTGFPEISPNDSDDHWYQSDGWGVKVHLPSDDD